MGMFDGLIERMQSMIEDTKEAMKKRDEQQWEYIAVGIPIDKRFSIWLNELGSDRWELIGIFGDQRYVFKRPKLEE
jgi:hypothetical protein